MSSESHTERDLRAQIAELEATVARVTKALEEAEKSYPDDWGVTYIYTSRLRAALTPEPTKPARKFTGPGYLEETGYIDPPEGLTP